VGQPGPIVVSGWGEEDLCLVLETAERLAVDDPVAVALERTASGRNRPFESRLLAA